MIYCIHSLFQKTEFEAHCVPCGKWGLAIVKVLDIPMTPCREANCPHEDTHTDALGELAGEPVCVRKLRPPNDKQGKNDKT